MSKRLITLLAALLVLGFVVAACGDDESDGGGNGDATSAQTVTDTDTGTATETATGDATETDTTTGTGTVTEEAQADDADRGGAAAPTPPARTKENCEKGINSAKQLDADVREQLAGLCDKATSDDPDDVREAAQEFCETMVDNLYSEGGADVPKGAPSRDEALEQCEQASQQAGDQAGGN